MLNMSKIIANINEITSVVEGGARRVVRQDTTSQTRRKILLGVYKKGYVLWDRMVADKVFLSLKTNGGSLTRRQN